MSIHTPKQNTVTRIFDYEFTWTSKHLGYDETRAMLSQYDSLGSKIIERLNVLEGPAKEKHGAYCRHHDLYKAIEDRSKTDQVLGTLWKEREQIPDWVDWEQIGRGLEVFNQYSWQILFGLIFKSVLSGMAAYRAAEVFTRTGGFGPEVTRRRLLETLQHFIECVESVESLKPGGKGYLSSVRVRLLHATVRERLLQIERSKPGYFDTAEFGIPINDLHTVGTICLYSTALVYMVLPRQEIHLSRQQAADFISLWRWVGYVMGTPVDWMSSPEQAKVMMESAFLFELQPSPRSKMLADNIFTTILRFPNLETSTNFLAAQTYRLNGPKLSSALGIAKPGFLMLSLIHAQYLLLRIYSYSYLFMSINRQKSRSKSFRALCEHLIFDTQAGGIGERTQFTLQYVPAWGKMLQPVLSSIPEKAKSTYYYQLDRNKVILTIACILGLFILGISGNLR